MERIGIFGLSWRNGGADSLARYTIPVDQRPERVPELADTIGVDEMAYLATCNRVEVMLVGDGETSMEEYRSRVYEALTGERPNNGEAKHELRAWAGEGAVEHFFLVTSGLDSANPGETEIMGQVKGAFKVARDAGLVGPKLRKLFEEAVRVARRIHNTTGLNTGKTSLANIAIDHILNRHRERSGPVAFVGVSDMTVTAARELAGEGVECVIVNRTLSRAREFGDEIGATAISLEGFRASPPRVEAIMLATGSKEPVIDRAQLSTINDLSEDGDILIVDMSIPPNVLPEDAAALKLRRIGMDDVTDEAARNRERRLAELGNARVCVDEALDELNDWMAERNVAPVVVELRDRYRRNAREQIDKLLDRKLANLDQKDKETLREWADSMARRLAKIPLIGLRSLAVKQGPESVEAFLDDDDEIIHDEMARVAERFGKPASRELE